MLYISGFCYGMDFLPEISWMNVSVGLLAMFLSLYYVVQLYCTVQFYMTSALTSDLRERDRVKCGKDQLFLGWPEHDLNGGKPFW